MKILNIVEVVIIIILFSFTLSLFMSRRKLKIYKIVILELVLLLLVGHFTYDTFIKKPTITIIGEKDITIEAGQEYVDQGAKSDLHGRDISSLIETNIQVDTSKIGDYKVLYKLVYKNRIVENERVVHVIDTTPPTIELIGNNTINVPSNSEYQEEGYIVQDSVDGEINNNVEIKKEEISENQYKLIYTARDFSGNFSSIERIINIIEPIKKEDKSKNGYVYLTFDDGPSFDMTPKILDILKEENVKATFFIINYKENKKDLVKRIVEEGHSIGIHGNSHKYSEEYKSVDSYVNTIHVMEEKIKSDTGITTSLIRFPGGSSNTISSKYCEGIMSKLSKIVLQNGYRYFDWNIDSEDSGGAKNADEVYCNVVNGLSKKRPNVILMHDYNGNKKTLEALRNIIRYCKNNGYTIDKISDDTPMITHKIAN